MESEILYKMSIQCSLAEISAVDMTGTALGIEMTTRNQCLSKCIGKQSGHVVIKLFACSTQLSMKF